MTDTWQVVHFRDGHEYVTRYAADPDAEATARGRYTRLAGRLVKGETIRLERVSILNERRKP